MQKAELNQLDLWERILRLQLSLRSRDSCLITFRSYLHK